MSGPFLQLLAEALRVARATGRAVDPTVGGLVRLGYDRDIALAGAAAPSALPAAAPVPGWRTVDLDTAGGAVAIPAGASLDLGVVAKARAADVVASRVVSRCGCGVAIVMGGDVREAGPVAHGGSSVGAGDRFDPASPVAVVGVHGGGVATFGVGARRWCVGAHEVHDIVDPANGRPARSGGGRRDDRDRRTCAMGGAPWRAAHPGVLPLPGARSMVRWA